MSLAMIHGKAILWTRQWLSRVNWTWSFRFCLQLEYIWYISKRMKARLTILDHKIIVFISIHGSGSTVCVCVCLVHVSIRDTDRTNQKQKWWINIWIYNWCQSSHVLYLITYIEVSLAGISCRIGIRCHSAASFANIIYQRLAPG